MAPARGRKEAGGEEQSTIWRTKDQSGFVESKLVTNSHREHTHTLVWRRARGYGEVRRVEHIDNPPPDQ